jgi:hypothetical protein
MKILRSMMTSRSPTSLCDLPDKISPCTVGLCGPLHGGYQDNILEDSILEDT